MKKMLMLASVASMIDQFNMFNIKLLQNMGYEVQVAANFKNGNTSSEERMAVFKQELEQLNVPYFQIDFERDVTHIAANIKAYRQIIDLINKNNYEFIHCHSPIGGVCGRLAAYKTNTKVIYTAHGFHFFKGAPLVNWILYYPIEKFLAKFTDVLITINKEDYNRAQKFKAKKVVYIPGVGVDTEKFANRPIEKAAKRKELGLPDDAFVVLSVGELNNNKNHETVIKAVAKLNNPNVYYIICGRGQKEEYLHNLAHSIGVGDRVKFLGFRTDIDQIYKISDVFVLPSLREGLSVALMEAMASGLPCIVSSIRGNMDLIEHGKGGYLVEPHDVDGFAACLDKLISNLGQAYDFGKYNVQYIKAFDRAEVEARLKEIYETVIE